MYFTKCVDCGDTLEVSYVSQEAHPGCRPSAIYQLTQDWCAAAQRDDIPECQKLQAEIDKHDRVPELGASALWYAEVAHWPVFPLRPGEKIPATKRGFKDASVDPDQIRKWWQESPTANIGLVAGLHWDVIDVDGPIGIRSMSELAPDVLPDIHAKASTPRGFHLFTERTGNGNRVAVLPGVDYRAVGGYVAASPSIVDGRRYTWLIPPSPAIMKAV